ncbi:MAG: hypothetical protein M3552_05205 [Planctomycetota bacterium]|nr:hypothetical protein [Planctomycetaceae bacterium]MDQ3330037.1 hypothetical protein [Planctomycetota bacterium]
MYGSHPPRTAFVALLFVSAACLARPSAAQDAPAAKADGIPAGVAPEIRGVLTKSEIVLDRLQTAMKLTTDKEFEQYATLKDFIEVFLIGVDRQKPVRLDVLTGKNETSYRLHVPIAEGQFRDFWKENLVPLGIPVQGYAKQPGLYRLGGNAGAAFNGLMLYDPKQRGGYATIVEDAKELPPPNGPVPTAGVQDLLKSGHDAALSLRNQAKGIEERHAHFAAQREDVLGKLKRDTDESASDFNLRKFAAGVQFDETERLYAEAKDVFIGLQVTPESAQAKGALRLEPLPGTSLADSVALISQNASRFAGVPRGEGGATTGRINFPLDPMRKEHFLALSAKIRENEIEEVGLSQESNPAQKEAGKQFLTGFFDLIDEGLTAGLIDGFIEMAKGHGELYTIVGGLKSPDGTKWIPVLSLVPQLRNGPTFKENVGEHAGVTFHEMVVTKEQHPDFIELFGDGRLLVGTAKDAVWYAAGPQAEETLKQAIDQSAGAGEPEATFLSFRGELLPGLRILDRRLGTTGFDKFRKMAIDAFENGDGRASIEMTKNGDAIDGSIVLEPGILRLVGKALADFSQQNLAE